MLPPFDSAVTINSLTLLGADQPVEEFHQKFLRFSLAQDSVLLPLDVISEVLQVHVTDILPVPEMPACVMGIYNWRGEMLWLIDLGHLVDYPPLSLQKSGETFMAMVLQINAQSIGLVVQCVNEIELQDPRHLQPPTTGLFPSGLLPFVKGYLPGNNGVVIDIESIARFPLWQVHRGYN